MDTLSAKDPKQRMSEHLVALKDYAMRVIAQGQVLSADEEDDKEVRFREFARIGDSFTLSEREMVCLMFKSILSPTGNPNCSCTDCHSDHPEERWEGR